MIEISGLIRNHTGTARRARHEEHGTAGAARRARHEGRGTAGAARRAQHGGRIESGVHDVILGAGLNVAR